MHINLKMQQMYVHIHNIYIYIYMVRRLFQNYCMTHGPNKQKLTRFMSLLLKNRYALQKN